MKQHILSTAWDKDHVIPARSYAEAKRVKDHYEELVKRATAELNSYEKNSNGMTPDHIRATKEWQDSKAYYDHVFKCHREYNQFFLKHWKGEYLAERKSKRNALHTIQQHLR